MTFVEEPCGIVCGGCGFEVVSVTVKEGKTRTAGIAGNGLRMMPPRLRAFVFAAAALTHGKRIHCRALAVVGNFADNAVTRTAVDAGGCPVSLVAPALLKDILHAFIADCDIRGYETRKRSASAALFYNEIVPASGTFRTFDARGVIAVIDIKDLDAVNL